MSPSTAPPAKEPHHSPLSAPTISDHSNQNELKRTTKHSQNEMSGLKKSAKQIEIEKYLRQTSLQPKTPQPSKSWVNEQAEIAENRKPGPWGYNNELPQAQKDIEEMARKQDAERLKGQAEKFEGGKGKGKEGKKGAKFIVGGMNGSDSE